MSKHASMKRHEIAFSSLCKQRLWICLEQLQWYALISAGMFWTQVHGGTNRFRQLSLTWGLKRKTALIHKRREVARLREVLLVGVQVCLHVVQVPLVTRGGRQLLLVCGVVVLRVEGGRFICRHEVLRHKRGDRVRARGVKYSQTEGRGGEKSGTHLTYF